MSDLLERLQAASVGREEYTSLTYSISLPVGSHPTERTHRRASIGALLLC